MDGFRTRQYDVYVFLADPNAVGPWNWEIWQHLFQPLTPIVESPRGRTSVRMFQTETSGRHERVQFGQIGWNDKSHRKWTHGSPDTAALSPGWEFRCASIWAPGPGNCEKENNPCDGFVTIKDYLVDGMERRNCQFSSSVLFAVAHDRDGMAAPVSRAIDTIRRLVNPVFAATTMRSWAGAKDQKKQLHNISLTDCDAFGAPFVHGRQHDKKPDVAMLIGDWRAL